MNKNPLTGNTFRFDWMKACRWTMREIGSTFGVSRAIAQHIQSTFCNEAQAWEITKAHKELCNGQIGF